MQPASSLDRLAHLSALDPVAAVMRRVVQTVAQPQALRDFLHGKWLGHPLHAAAVQIPIGTWASASLLDLLPGSKRASTALIGTGVAAALPSVASGWTDWSELRRPEQARVGLVHAATNATAIGLYAASFAARVRGDYTRGKLLGFGGLAVVGIGGAIGGHLTYRFGAGVQETAPAPATPSRVDLTDLEATSPSFVR